MSFLVYYLFKLNSIVSGPAGTALNSLPPGFVIHQVLAMDIKSPQGLRLSPYLQNHYDG